MHTHAFSTHAYMYGCTTMHACMHACISATAPRARKGVCAQDQSTLPGPTECVQAGSYPGTMACIKCMCTHLFTLQFLEILHNYEDQQFSITEVQDKISVLFKVKTYPCNRSPRRKKATHLRFLLSSIESSSNIFLFLTIICQIFEQHFSLSQDHDDLLGEFNQFLPDSANNPHPAFAQVTRYCIDACSQAILFQAQNRSPPANFIVASNHCGGGSRMRQRKKSSDSLRRLRIRIEIRTLFVGPTRSQSHHRRAKHNGGAVLEIV